LPFAFGPLVSVTLGFGHFYFNLSFLALP